VKNLIGIILDKWVRPVIYGHDYTGGTDKKVAVDPTTKATLVKIDGLTIEHWRQLVWYIDGTVATGDGQAAKLRLPNSINSWDVGDVEMVIDTAPTGAALIIDIESSTDNSTWTTLFSTKPQINATANVDNGSHVFSDTSLAALDYVRLNVDQVGSTVAGADLTVNIKMLRRVCSGYVFDAASSTKKAAGVYNSFTFSHTCSGTNRLLVVGVAEHETSYNITKVEYNGVLMTEIRKDFRATTANDPRSYIYYLINPASGANNVEVFVGSNPNNVVIAGAVSFTGAKQSGQPDANNGNNGESTASSVSVTTVADNTIVVDSVSVEDGPVLTVDGSQTERWNLRTGGEGSGGGSTESKATAGAVSMDWTHNNKPWAISAASFAPVPDVGTYGFIT